MACELRLALHGFGGFIMQEIYETGHCLSDSKLVVRPLFHFCNTDFKIWLFCSLLFRYYTLFRDFHKTTRRRREQGNIFSCIHSDRQ